MRRALPYIVVATLLCPPSTAAERPSWNHIRYIGGTVSIKASQYDWNTTLTVVNDAITIEIAPATVFQTKRTVNLKLSQVVSLSANEAAWQRVAAVDGAELPAKHPKLFGVLDDFYFLGIVYEEAGGKLAALLLESRFAGVILRVLAKETGKPVEHAP